MPEVKNAFIKSKMNKDLDARLIPSGEYRNAVNIQVSKSEGADVGAIENIKGNDEIANINGIEGVTGLDIIGYYVDESKNDLYIFSTDQDVDISEPVASNANCFLHKLNLNGSTVSTSKLLEGSFLNFSKESFITGVNLLEDLLFFTDNRNQPRVINVSLASPTHYTKEEQISVAKLAPYKPISLYKKSNYTILTIGGNGTTINVTASGSGITPDAQPGSIALVNGEFAAIVRDVFISSNPQGILLDRALTGSVLNQPVSFIGSTMANKTQEYLDVYNKQSSSPTVVNLNYDQNWEGDADFMEDKFIRFSYRYKFEDNQYSILAPFTQPLFIPKQFGYFMGDDDEQTYKTSVVNFFENFIQEAGLKIPMPSANATDDFKIKEIDIVYKESDALSVKVMATISASSFQFSNLESDEKIGYYYLYNYTSKKPYKTLPESEIVRVYDKVPVRAQSQEITSNRIVYGNYVDKYSPPAELPDYRVSSGFKDKTDTTAAEYSSHTLKQNRTYQVGIVLSDRYGRSTSVLLSKRDDKADGSGSTIFHPYIKPADIADWRGDVMQFILESPVPESSSGSYPGFYASSLNGSKQWDINGATVARVAPGVYSINDDISSAVSVGDYLRGRYVDYVEVTNVNWNGSITTIECDGDFSNIYVEDSISPVDYRQAYVINDLGWYSYKIVVKQTEQEYYNVYLPLVVNGQFRSSDGANLGPNPNVNSLAQAVLINDNINKVPRDLSEVGPDQKQYGSSVRLFGRINPSALGGEQWTPNISSDQVSTIASARDSGYDLDSISSSSPVFEYLGLYNAESNPLIATISSLAPAGATDTFGETISTTSQSQYLSIYETDPTISLLDIFWETSTSGLLSDLNLEAYNNFQGIISVDPASYNFSYNESDAIGTNLTGAGANDGFFFSNPNGPIVGPLGTVQINSVTVTDGGGGVVGTASWSSIYNRLDVAGFRIKETTVTNKFKIENTQARVFLQNANARTFNFSYNVTFTNTSGEVNTSNVVSSGILENEFPGITNFPSSFQYTTADTSFFTIPNVTGATVSNGTASASQSDRLDELVYEKLTESNQYGPTTNLQINPTTGLVSRVNPSGGSMLDTTISFRAKDCNGSSIGLSQQTPTTTTLNFGPPASGISSQMNVPEGGNQNRYMIGYVGSTSNPTTSLPSGVPSSTCAAVGSNTCHFSVPIFGGFGGLTQGQFEMHALLSHPPYQSGNGTFSYAQVWVQYQSASGQSWIAASPTSISSGYTAYGQMLSADNSNPDVQFSAIFSTPGNYRVSCRFLSYNNGSASNSMVITFSDPNHP